MQKIWHVMEINFRDALVLILKYSAKGYMVNYRSRKGNVRNRQIESIIKFVTVI